MLEIRPATAQDYVAIAGKGFPLTSYAYAIEAEGEVVAVAGHYLKDGSAVVFSRIAPAARERLRFFGRHALNVGRKVTLEAARYGIPVLAEADGNILGSGRLLEHLGFTHEYEGVYLWHGR